MISPPCIHTYLLFLLCLCTKAQTTYQYRSVMFYNLENLFDTIDDPATHDEYFTPEGGGQWTKDRYTKKINQLAKLIATFDPFGRSSGADIIGVCEVENRQVLNDLVSAASPKPLQYRFIHTDSPDRRGIDVALLYKPSVFQPLNFQHHPLIIYNREQYRQYTRDQLVVHGFLDDEELYLIINHWPSRRGGQARSETLRLAAARLTSRIIDSINGEQPGARIIVMGDFNDNPDNLSIQSLVKAGIKSKASNHRKLFNAMDQMHKSGLGSLAYRDRWSLFDQIMMSAELMWPKPGYYRFWKAGIYKPEILIQQKGPYRGYPKRTYSAGLYQGGYSDHFPVYVVLIKPKA